MTASEKTQATSLKLTLTATVATAMKIMALTATAAMATTITALTATVAMAMTATAAMATTITALPTLLTLPAANAMVTSAKCSPAVFAS